MKKMIITSLVTMMVTAGICGGINHNNTIKHAEEIAVMEEQVEDLYEEIDVLSANYDDLNGRYERVSERYDMLAENYRKLDEAHTGLTTEVSKVFNGGDYNIRMKDESGMTTIYYRDNGLQKEVKMY